MVVHEAARLIRTGRPSAGRYAAIRCSTIRPGSSAVGSRTRLGRLTDLDGARERGRSSSQGGGHRARSRATAIRTCSAISAKRCVWSVGSPSDHRTKPSKPCTRASSVSSSTHWSTGPCRKPSEAAPVMVPLTLATLRMANGLRPAAAAPSMIWCFAAGVATGVEGSDGTQPSAARPARASERGPPTPSHIPT